MNDARDAQRKRACQMLVCYFPAAHSGTFSDVTRLPWMLRLVLLAGLVLRLGWGFTRSSDPDAIEQLPDQREYLQLSNNLLHGQGLRFYDPRFRAEVVAYRMPGYPIFLAAFGGSAQVARVAQSFVDTSTALAVYLLARRWLTSGFSTLAAALVAFNPFLIYFSGLILSETLYTALLLWGMWLLQQSGPWGITVLVLSVTVRPSGVGLVILLTIASALLNRDRRGAYPRWWPAPPATTALLLLLAGLTPWAYRNYKVLGRWIWTTTNGGITLYDGFNDQATGASDQRFVRSIPGLVQDGELGRDEFFGEQARHWIRQHPKRSLELAVKKIIRTWSPVPLSSEYGRPLYQWIGGLYALPFDVLVVLGLCYGRLPWGVKVLLVLPAIYITAIHAMSVGSLRYRLPADPPMAILAVVSCQLLVARKGEFQRAAAVANSN
jgi:hypothetical protein